MITLHKWYPGRRKAAINIKSNKCVVCQIDVEQFRRKCTNCIDSAHRAKESKKGFVRRKRIKAQEYESIDVISVFEKHKWVCQQCRCKTPKTNISKTLPDAPTLDHIIPVSKGGGHLYSNVQLLCRACNTSKGNRIPKMDNSIIGN